MANKTGIEWTETTWNPVTGCTKVSQGCKHCYAERIWPRVYPDRKFTNIQCHPYRLEIPLRLKQPRMIFVNSMSDLFHEEVPEDFIAQVVNVIGRCPQHTFQILTKRPDRAQQLFTPELDRLEEVKQIIAETRQEIPTWDWPLKNLWLGVSVENQETYDERSSYLLKTPAAVRFVSYEPALGPVDFDFDEIDIALEPDGYGNTAILGPIHWVIAGGESGPKARPMHPDWARSVRDQCRKAGVPFFFKQWGEWAPSRVFGTETKLRETEFSRFPFGDDVRMNRCGKIRAGRSLDGQIWEQYPNV